MTTKASLARLHAIAETLHAAGDIRRMVKYDDQRRPVEVVERRPPPFDPVPLLNEGIALAVRLTKTADFPDMAWAADAFLHAASRYMHVEPAQRLLSVMVDEWNASLERPRRVAVLTSA